MSEKVAQPKAAQHQVWRIGDGSEVVLGDEESPGMFRTDRSMVANFDLCGREYGWSCIGLVTPHGRVMVGERRHYAAHAYVIEIVGVMSPSHVSWRADGGGMVHASSADIAARWPLISPPAAAEQKIVASNQSGSPAYLHLLDSFERRSGSWSCACGLPMPSGCVMCPGCAAEKILTPKETDAYQQAIEDCNRAIMVTACGPSADPREQGPGISRQPPPEVRPDVVVTAVWEDRWTTP